MASCCVFSVMCYEDEVHMIKKCKYQFMICCPQNIATKVPVIKNGANGIWLFNPNGSLLFNGFPEESLNSNRVDLFRYACARRSKTINPTPIIAPKKNAKNMASRIFGHPNTSPNKIASFTSPKPIHSPWETRYISKKKAEATMAAKI